MTLQFTFESGVLSASSSNEFYEYPETQTINEIVVYGVTVVPISVHTNSGPSHFVYDATNKSVWISCMMLLQTTDLLRLVYE